MRCASAAPPPPPAGPWQEAAALALILLPLLVLQLRDPPPGGRAGPLAAALAAGLLWLQVGGMLLALFLALQLGSDMAGTEIHPEVTRPAALLPAGLGLLWATLSRATHAGAERALARTGLIGQRAAILGSGAAAAAALAWLARNRAEGLHLVGLVEDGSDPETIPGLRVLGPITDLIRIAQTQRIDLLVVAPRAEPVLQAEIEELRRLPVRLCLLGQPFPLFPRARWRLAAAGGRSFVEFDRMPLQGRNALLKRGFDILVAGALLLLLLPSLLLIALAIRLDSPGPVLFRQPRRGRHNEVFAIYKFRTMRAEAADPGCRRQTSRGDARLTRVGAMLRRHSLDELPQLLNVLRGEMSLVGPRPHALFTAAGGVPVEQASRAYLARTYVRPGITGLAQVNGWRGELDTLDKLHGRIEHDIAYIETWSFWADLRILLRTLPRVLRDRRAY